MHSVRWNLSMKSKLEAKVSVRAISGISTTSGVTLKFRHKNPQLAVS